MVCSGPTVPGRRLCSGRSSALYIPPAAPPGSPLLRRVGSLIESPGFVPHLSGIENLKAYWEAGGQALSAANLDQALAIAGLGSAIRRKVRTYSKGMQQRLALAQVLLNKPELLVLDEPTIGLDPGEMRDVRELIRSLADHGATVLLSSHILVEVEQVCSHVAVMNLGKLVASGTVDELIGASQSVYLEVDDVGRAVALLKSIPGVSRVEGDAGGISISLSGVERKVIVTALVHANIGVETIESRHRLEDAFLGIVEGTES
ncbi:MAG: ABC transporter ATP-binding protein [Chloroflexi bacterium]|nr:MAG: ABC transporter ATP-binding protein [Chloroflexota bacterium]